MTEDAGAARRERSNAASAARGLVNRMDHLTEEYDHLMTLAERKVLGAAAETLREFSARLGRLADEGVLALGEAEQTLYRYYVTMHGGDEREVTPEEWRAAERAAGFTAPEGRNATSGFDGRGITGRMEIMKAGGGA